MLIKKIIDKKILEIIFAAFLAYYFKLTVLQSAVTTISFFVLAAIIFIFLNKIEYVFYFLLASRSIIDMFVGVNVASDIKMAQFIAVLIISLFFIYFVIFSQYKFINMFSLSVNKIYGCFLILSLAALFTSSSIMGGLRSWLRFLQIFVIMNMTIFIVLSSGNESYMKKMNIICWSAVVSLILPLVMFLNNVIQGVSFSAGGAVRYATFGAHMNIFSYLLMAILPFCLFLYAVTGRNIKKILWLLFLALIVFTAYMTNTRNIWIGFIILICSWVIFRKKIIFIFLLLCAAFLVVSYVPTIAERFAHFETIKEFEGGFFDMDGRLLSGRIGSWQNFLKYFIDHSTLLEKLIGNGFGISIEVTKLYGDLWHSKEMGEHNNYLTLLMATGIFGLFFYMCFIIKLFQESFKLLRRTKNVYFLNLSQVFLSVLVSYVVISIFTHIIWHTTYQIFFSVFAGLIIAANIIEDNRVKFVSKPGEKDETIVAA